MAHQTSEQDRPEINDHLVSLVADWHRSYHDRGAGGNTHESYVTRLRGALKGKVRAFVGYARLHPGPESDLALEGIKKVYDFHWPQNASAGYIFGFMWGWLQLELEKPEESKPAR